MAHLRLQDLPPEMRAKVSKQLGIECPDGFITTYHVSFLVAGKLVRMKSTDKEALAKVLDEWKLKHPLIPYSVHATKTEVV